MYTNICIQLYVTWNQYTKVWQRYVLLHIRMLIHCAFWSCAVLSTGPVLRVAKPRANTCMCRQNTNVYMFAHMKGTFLCYSINEYMTTRDFVSKQSLTKIRAWINNWIFCFVGGYYSSMLDFNGGWVTAVEVKAWKSSYIPQFYVNAITYPGLNHGAGLFNFY